MFTRANIEEFHCCNKCTSYRYDAFEKHEYDEQGFNPKYGQIAFIDEDGSSSYHDIDWDEDENQQLEHIKLELVEKDRYNDLTLYFSGICPKCHTKYFWRQHYAFEYEMP